ncbi:MAG: O-antigen ligase family protein, partial [Planctomycetes bacterium]|nr:O-antigen ligase family protein [Planctomycetota bacterium]
YIIIFLITVSVLKRTDQIKRLITAIIITSLPVVLYGFSQLKWPGVGRLDPLNWGTDFSHRIASSLGNTVFLGAYLIMVIPLTLARLITTVAAFRKKINEPRTAIFISLLFYALLFGLQLLALVFTKSRGPTVGLIAGLFFFAVCYFIYRRKKTLVVISYAAAVGLILFLVVFNLPDSPLSGLRENRYIGRLGKVFESQTGSGKVRLLIWEGITNMVKDDPGRAVVGYGPETLFAPFHKYSPRELVRFEHRIAYPDRSHNEFFDTLITTGFIGLAVYLLIFGLIIFYGFKWLNIIAEKTRRRILILCLFGGGLVGLLIPVLIQDSFIFVGVGIPLGLLAGAVLYLFIYSVFFLKPDGSQPTNDQSPFPLLLIALLAALLGHFLETQFGFSVTPTSTYFWILLAVFIAAGRLYLKTKTEPEPPPPETETRNKNNIYFYSALMVLILVVGLYNFVTKLNIPDPNQPGVSLGYFSILYDSLATVFETPNFLFSLLMLFGWLIIGIFITAQLVEQSPSVDQKTIKPQQTFFIFLNISIVGFLVYFLIHSIFLFTPVASPPANSVNFIKTLHPTGQNAISIFYLLKPPGSLVIILFHIWLTLNLIWLALTLPRPGKKKTDQPWLRPANLPFHLVLIIFLVLIVVKTNLNPLRASPIFKSGDSFEDIKHWDEVIKRYQKVLDMTINHTNYYASLARAYQNKYFRARDPKKRKQYLEKSHQYLLKSLAFSPLDHKRNANLGRFYRLWARTIRDPAKQREKFRQAADAYQKAVELSPVDPQLINEWGSTYSEMKDYDRALSIYQQSLTVDANFVETMVHLGDAYLETRDQANALKYYEQAGLIYFQGREIFRDANQIALFVRTNEFLLQHRPEYYQEPNTLTACRRIIKKIRFKAPPELQQRLDNLNKQINRKK